MRGESELKVGCCGFTVSQKMYFRRFNLIEIQQTFYQPPQSRTAEKWRASAPDGFEFTLKAWQLITHEPTSPTYRRLSQRIDPSAYGCYGRFRPTEEVFEAWDRTASLARILGATVLVFQSPASFRPTDDNMNNMRHFFSQIDRQGHRCVWEPRGVWPEELIRRLCVEFELTHCVDPFKNIPLHGDFQYFRLHGITGFSYRYTDADLQRLVEWAERKPTYVLFNNNSMTEDASRLLAHKGRQG